MNIRSKSYYHLNNLISLTLRSPQYLILFLSDECPNNCIHCWYDDDWKSRNIKSKVLTIDELERIAKSIPFLEFLSLTGGEAFLRDELVDIVCIFNKNTHVHRFDIPTSGFDPELISTKVRQILEVLAGKPFRVDISLDGLKAVHNSIRRNPHAFDNAVATINELKLIRKIYSNFDISIISTLSENNYNDVIPLAEFVEDILPDGEWMVNIARPATNRVKINNNNVLEAYKKANEFIDERRKNGRFSGDSGHSVGKLLTIKNAVRRETIIDTINGNRVGGGCSAGALAGVMALDGEVRGCESIETSMGNIRDFHYDLPKLWNSPKANEFRRKIQEAECICTHECFLSVSLLIQPSNIIKMIKKI